MEASLVAARLVEASLVEASLVEASLVEAKMVEVLQQPSRHCECQFIFLSRDDASV